MKMIKSLLLMFCLNSASGAALAKEEHFCTIWLNDSIRQETGYWFYSFDSRGGNHRFYPTQAQAKSAVSGDCTRALGKAYCAKLIKARLECHRWDLIPDSEESEGESGLCRLWRNQCELGRQSRDRESVRRYCPSVREKCGS